MITFQVGIDSMSRDPVKIRGISSIENPSSYRKEGSEEDRTGHPSHPRKTVERGETIPSFSRRGQVSSFRITRAVKQK